MFKKPIDDAKQVVRRLNPERDVAEKRISKSSVSDTKHFYTATDSAFIE
ncbi:hypothetical protein MUO79_11885 [Candidatus Bathyarchaeota archaeon]|nr:hypothetical protein [Candidatus Bathyarchaeota archaeon]